MIQECFQVITPKNDDRCKISSNNFLSSVVMSFASPEKEQSIEGLRRGLINDTGEKVVKSTFYERFSSNRTNDLLINLLTYLLAVFSKKSMDNQDIKQALGVSDIVLIDSSIVSLWHPLYEKLKGTFTTAAIKLNLAFSIVNKKIPWFSLSEGKDHDKKNLDYSMFVKGVLYIFDLGYWDYELLTYLFNNGSYFLSRVKSGSKLEVVKIIRGISHEFIGRTFDDIRIKKYKGDIVEFFCILPKNILWETVRVVGFWNDKTNQYHFYITNLSCSAGLIYTLYKLRWQIEIFFKSLKFNFKFDQIKTANFNIVHNLILCSLIAQIICFTILPAKNSKKSSCKKYGYSILKSGKVFSHIARTLVSYLIKPTQETLSILKKKIDDFKDEIYNKEFANKSTTFETLAKGCAC